MTAPESQRFARFYRGANHLLSLIATVSAILITFGRARAETFALPTANHALFEKDGEEKFFVGTVGKPWTTGTFGCVRTEGEQMHEGLDIRCLQRDRRNEPTDPVMATADGTVTYISRRPGLSNYGNYIVLKHIVEGIEVYSLYGHLREIREGLGFNQAVKAGEVIAVMGRTANTREGISKDRAHVHFELNLLLNDKFSAWYKSRFPTQRNDHGEWNGQNLLGMDPKIILLNQHSNPKFSLLEFIRHQPELCRVQIRDTNFSWLKRYRSLIRINPLTEKEGIAGYEIALNANGIPFDLTPRAASEMKGKSRVQLLSVNEAEQRKNPCRHLVVNHGGKWDLGRHGLELMDLLTFRLLRH
jgi:murein DD-endopeptidase MepM/ murein hydrolase activator NlpD